MNDFRLSYLIKLIIDRLSSELWQCDFATFCVVFKEFRQVGSVKSV